MVKLLQKINPVRNHEVVMFPHELVRANGKNLTHSGRVVEKRIIMLWKREKIK